MNKKQKKMLARIASATALLIAASLVHTQGMVKASVYLVIYLVIGYDILLKAGRGIVNRRLFDENFLMATATLGAFLLAVITKSGEYIEGVAVMLFYQVGELFQSYAVAKSRRNISDLMNIRPEYANLEQDGELVRVAPDEVAVGSIITVQPGERLPLDGVVIEGGGSLNTAAINGESLPRDVTVGDEVVSGCINLTGVLKIRTTKEFGESTVSKILELVENAGLRKARSETFISRFSRVYTPCVCACAVLIAVLPALIGMFFGASAQWQNWVYRGLTFLVVSCPCALVISIPLSFFAGIGGAGHEGILVKGANYLEALSKTSCVVFDKTGTLTEGKFEVSAIHHNRLSDDDLLECVALVECASSHPISLSLKKAYGKSIDRNRVTDIEEIGGLGITASVDGRRVGVGNERLMERLGIGYRPCSSVGTIIHVVIDGEYAGHIVITDVIKPNAERAVSLLKKVGVERTVILTGDAEGVARKVAEKIGVDEVHGGLFPADKVRKLEELIVAKKANEKIAFVGDGINDAPVLTRADIGIAMGAMGSDAAIEAADVVLMDDDPMKLVKAVKISAKCIKIVKQNIIFALIVKFSCLALSTVGIANMWFAVFADVGVMVIAVLNAVRALRVHSL